MEPESVVTAFGRCGEEHDLEGAMSLVTEDIVFDDTEPAPDGTRHRGVAAVRDAWRPILENAASIFHAEDTFSAGDRVVQLWRYTWGDGHVRGTDVFRVRDGRVSEKFSYVKG